MEIMNNRIEAIYIVIDNFILLNRCSGKRNPLPQPLKSGP